MIDRDLKPKLKWAKVNQMVHLMDRLLKLEGMHLHLTPYQVHATGQDEGMLEYIPWSLLAHVTSYWGSWTPVATAGFPIDLFGRKEHDGIISYLQKSHPDEDGPFDITVNARKFMFVSAFYAWK